MKEEIIEFVKAKLKDAEKERRNAAGRVCDSLDGFIQAYEELLEFIDERE